MNIREGIKQNSTWVFFILSYLFSWICWIPLSNNGFFIIIGRFGPTISGLLLTATFEGREGIQDIIDRLFVWRLDYKWYIFTFLGTAIVVLTGIWMSTIFEDFNPVFNDPGEIYLIIPVFLYVLFLSVLGEETGWRGYALPKLQNKTSALNSSLIIGVIWSLWHLPLFWLEGDFHRDIPLILFLIQSIALSIIFTWLYNNTRSLLISHLFHAASNTTLGILPVLPIDTGGTLGPLWNTVVVLCLLTTIIVYYYGPKYLMKNHGTHTGLDDR